MKEFYCALLLIGIFAAFSQGQDLCSEKKCTSQGQICVVNNHHQAKCQCRESCPRSRGHERVCGSDGITYRSRCVLDMTSCKVGFIEPITVASNGKCKATSLKVSRAHQSSQTLISGKRGEIHCGIEGRAVQVLWKKVVRGRRQRLAFPRVLALNSNSKTLRFHRVHPEDAGKYVCSAYSGTSTAEATVTVAVTDPKTLDTNVAAPHVCRLEKLIGTGTGNFSTKWYFDSKNGKCQRFLYSGVGGNENNFDSKDLCLRKCLHAAGDICSMPERPGPCEAYFPRWFYNPDKGKCEAFVYGGCNGNANNFKTTEECEETCSASHVCGKAPETGPCKAYFRRYFFNQTSGQCDKFIYGGCLGNSNNFPTLELCQTKCQKASNLTPKDKREKPGRCPWQRNPPRYCITSWDTCKSDEECDSDKKCCMFGCGKECALPLSANKPGKCPKVPRGHKVCNKKGDVCDRDTDCPGTRKCCYNGCQRDCSVPEAPQRIKPGVCPGLNAINPNLCKITKNECKRDADCFGHLKCCFNGCHNECLKRPRPRPKPGVCPLADYIPPENCSDTEDKCMDDTQCPGRDKCCATGCLQECITPPAVKKPGLCSIVDYIPPELCEVTEDECEEDEDCKGRDKCCATGCIKECITPPIIVKTGKCPILDSIPRELCNANEDECENDNDCQGKDKCCATGCIKECITPPIVVKPGECPVADSNAPELCNATEDECENDNDCQGKDKCCATGCMKECVTTPGERPVLPPKVGHCPKPWKGLDGICDRRGDMCDNDESCNVTAKCCFNGCQKDCIEPVVPVSKTGVCPKPWKGQDGICDRRGDMCSVDMDCDKSEKCCFNGCQRDCVKPGTRELSEKPGQCPNPWKEQPCDRRGDMCQTDLDCGDSGSKCCHNGCQKDCVKPVNLTKCQTETQEALDKLALDPPMVGVFVPKCKPDGQYEDEQCHELYCWCVDKDGKKMQDTVVRGMAVCLPQDKPGKCPKPWKGQNGICDYRGDMCLQDSDCSGDERCCSNGCQNDCVPPEGIKLCKKHKVAHAANHDGPPLVGAFVPSCKLNGDYEEIQCHGSTGFCWCVDKLGNELPGTPTRGEPNCIHSAKNVGAGKDGTCPKPWKGATGFCDKKGDECGMDFHCSEKEKCCFSGCQRMCVKTTEAHQKGGTKPGQCPKPWLGQEGLCDRRGDMCEKDVDCKRSQICCFNGCQNDCVDPGLSTCQKRYEESFIFPSLGRFVPSCKKDGRFHERQCHPSTGHCWCVDSYGIEMLGTRTRGRPNCTVPDPCLSTTCPYYGECVPSKDRKSVDCKCNIACTFIYDPVCGTDGNTYANECVMRSTACVQKKNITVDYKGECEEVDPCASVFCGFYSECDVVNGSVTCVCPGSGSRPSCSNEKKPICGSNGEIYNNICHLMNASCQQQVMVLPALPENCEDQVDPCSNITCSHPLQECNVTDEGKPKCKCPVIACTRDYQPVCGTDGKTYSNECMMDLLTCEANKIVSVDYEGECTKGVEEFSVSADLCSSINCSHPIARCEVINETATCVCPIFNTLEYFPVCGSDGVTYSNPGALDIASCNSGGAITKIKDGECSKLHDPCEVSLCSHKHHMCEVQNGTAVCVCNMACTLEYAPVCASDNKTYPNKCAMEVAACQSGQRLRVIQPGRCEGVVKERPNICPRPWKGQDGICDRRGDMCQSNADCEEQRGGKCCFNGCQRDCVQFGNLECPQKCHPNAQCIELVIGGRQCVCNPGYEGDGIECAADPCSVKKCKHYSMCMELHGMGKCVCPEVCPALYAPVCGSDGNVYDNECQMKVASCTQQKKITLASKETCKPDPCKKSKCSHPQHRCIKTSVGAVCVCPPSACTREYAPVCGSDGKTYPNSCVLKATACERSQNVTLASQGECREENTNPCDVPSLCTHPYHKCELVGSRAMCVCPMIIPANLAPVCGSDGQTYPNPAALESMSCLANRIVEIQYEGQCPVPTDPCDISLCSHSRHHCEVVDGMATCVCNEICPLILLPVCGSDGQSYPNNCSLEVEACTSGKELTVVAMGECDQCENKVCPDPRQYCRVVNGSATCVCNEICTLDWSPVCGSDGKTYPNKCSLEVEACKTGQRLRKVRSGECDSMAGECPVLNPTPVCAGNRTGCAADDECSFGEKCCLQKNCSNKCVQTHPLPPPSHQLVCPLINPMPWCGRPSKPNCFTGGPKCHPGEACCLDHDCIHKCVKPALPDGSRPGECPVPNPIPGCASVTGCESDSGCNLGERCCLQSNCTKTCVKTRVPPSPPPDGTRPGECPVLNPTPGCASVNGCESDSICSLGERCCLQSDCTKKCIKTKVPPTPPPQRGLFRKQHHGYKPICDPPCHRFGNCVRDRKTREHKCSCDRICPRIYHPVCGTDGVTYSTECMRMYLVCQKGTDVGFKHPGKCKEENEEDYCPVLNPTPMCASVTGCSDDSECQEGQKCCLHSNCTKMCYAQPKPGQCPVFKRKPCPLIVKPDQCTTDWDCAGDLKCCSDGCSKNCSSLFRLRLRDHNPCKFALCSYPRPVCKVVGNKATCQCRQNCPRHYDPVCASDGETYDNMCLLEMTACMTRGRPGGELTYLANGNCKVAQICSLPAETGRCRASMRRFFFNATSRKCEGFRFGGCEGNANRFDSEKECYDYCGSLDACQLKPCPDPYAVCSISDSGERECTCPQICTADDSPVCGTDGKTYSNECQLRVSACSQGMMIKVKSSGKCNNHPGFCPAVDPQVCSGHEDECFDDASCEANEKCCHDGCRKKCLKPLPTRMSGPPRQGVPQLVPLGLDKVPYVEDPCKKCKFPKTICSPGENGEAECLCPEVCTEEFAPVCGSDGRNYSNKCQLAVEACKPENIHTLKVKHLGACVCDLPPAEGLCLGYMPRYFFNATTKRCEGFVYGGCQGNGNNFETVSSCEDMCINPCKNYECPFPRTRCEVEEGLPVCKCPIICTADYRPVCGTDGKTYGNMCGLEAVACQAKHFQLKLDHLGECLSVNPCDGVVCSNKGRRCVVKNNKAVCVCNKVCTREYDPYCASDGKTYPNKCNLEVAQCESETNLTVLHPGQCTETVSGGGPTTPAHKFRAGKCPVFEAPAECPDEPEDFCSHDRDCSDDLSLKCCNTGCEFDCVVPDDEDDSSTTSQTGPTPTPTPTPTQVQTTAPLDACDLNPCPDPYATCIPDSGERKCTCPQICTADYSPVCGTDGQTYSNECQMRVAACSEGTMIKVKSNGTCNICDLPPVGGPCFGYFTRYFFNATTKRCESFIYGGCQGNGNNFKTVLSCKDMCITENPGSDDPCLLIKCPFHGACRVAESGNPVCECVTECPVIDEPVCGSDGKNYSSECVLKSQACQTKTVIQVVGDPAKCTSSRLKCTSCPASSHLSTHFCESDFVIEGTLEEIRSTQNEQSSVLMVKVTGMFKGPLSLQNKIIEINFSENLNSCFCKELELKKAIIIAGSTTDEGKHFLDKSSSFVRHSGKRLLEKVQQRTKHGKCDKI